MIRTSDASIDGWYGKLFVALALLLLGPIWLVDNPPIFDYPNHLARGFLLLHSSTEFTSGRPNATGRLVLTAFLPLKIFGATMLRYIDQMTAARANASNEPSWPRLTVENPTWNQVEHAIRRLDNTRYTAVELHRSGDKPEEVFCIIGGAGHWYLVDSVLRWEYNDPNGGDESIVIWKDMDMECQRKNLLTNLEVVVLIAKRFFETGSYEGLTELCC